MIYVSCSSLGSKRITYIFTLNSTTMFCCSLPMLIQCRPHYGASNHTNVVGNIFSFSWHSCSSWLQYNFDLIKFRSLHSVRDNIMSVSDNQSQKKLLFSFFSALDHKRKKKRINNCEMLQPIKCSQVYTRLTPLTRKTRLNNRNI